MIDPGQMRDRVTIQRRQIGGDGFQEEQFADYLTVWAKFRPTGGREFREGSVAVGEERATFSINFRDDVSQADRVIYRGTIWDVVSVARVGWKAGTDLNCVSTGKEQ